ncbi:hypothetical protein AB1I77_25615 [Bacillus paranthracis]|nr:MULTISPECIES: hypothetical protein [Bacillus cereus group]HDR3524001.1 hypothetical protein [Bacillus pacificus]HDR7875884.1 hypothetical protein [Bacillus mobilis]MBM6771572.1 hypothetical protein [Bacillus cereus]MCC2380843.1 hypothetical protein [Bacillus wiedmannii]MCC2424973.1 hypothetical protein [Bacillus wiedmannii]
MMEGIKEIATIFSLTMAGIASITVAVKNLHDIKKDKKKQKPKQIKRKRK